MKPLPLAEDKLEELPIAEGKLEEGGPRGQCRKDAQKEGAANWAEYHMWAEKGTQN